MFQATITYKKEKDIRWMFPSELSKDECAQIINNTMEKIIKDMPIISNEIQEPFSFSQEDFLFQINVETNNDFEITKINILINKKLNKKVPLNNMKNLYVHDILNKFKEKMV